MSEETEPTAEEVLASIRAAVDHVKADDPDLHRNRNRRELLSTVLGILDGVEPDSITASVPETEEEEEDDGLKAPPLFGPGSTVDAWRQYAIDLGLVVPDGAKRAEIVALIEAGEPADEDGDDPDDGGGKPPAPDGEGTEQEQEDEDDEDPDGTDGHLPDPAGL